MKAETIKQYRWVKSDDPKKIVNVWVHKEDNYDDLELKSYVTISGYNPFPFFGYTEFKTTYKVFSEWMKENGYVPMINTSNVFMDKTQTFI